MLRLTVEQLVFVNESLFNEITGWHHQSLCFRWSISSLSSFQNEKALLKCSFDLYERWISILHRYSRETESWFNDETFFRWLADELLSLCSLFSTSRSVIIMNNTSVHCNSRIEEFIISHECQISYLPRWIDDLSLIWMSDVIFAFLLIKLQFHRTHLQRIKDLNS